jgi:hypothetical protein
MIKPLFNIIMSSDPLKQGIMIKEDRNSSLAVTIMGANAGNIANCSKTGFRFTLTWPYRLLWIFLLIFLSRLSSCDSKSFPVSYPSKKFLDIASKPKLSSDEPLPSSNNAIVFSSAEYDALYELFISTDGANWRWQVPYEVKGQPWNFNTTTTANPCIDQWQGIICTEKNNAVSSLQLSDYNLAGIIPASIGNMRYCILTPIISLVVYLQVSAI